MYTYKGGENCFSCEAQHSAVQHVSSPKIFNDICLARTLIRRITPFFYAPYINSCVYLNAPDAALVPYYAPPAPRCGASDPLFGR
jgi:hypothetical protein